MTKFDVEMNFDNRIFTATAQIKGCTLTVSSVVLGSKSSSVSANNHLQASQLLRELLKDHIRSEISRTAEQERMAAGEADAWNTGKCISTVNAQASIILLECVRKELAKLRQQLKELS